MPAPPKASTATAIVATLITRNNTAQPASTTILPPLRCGRGRVLDPTRGSGSIANGAAPRATGAATTAFATGTAAWAAGTAAIAVGGQTVSGTGVSLGLDRASKVFRQNLQRIGLSSQSAGIRNILPQW